MSLERAKVTPEALRAPRPEPSSSSWRSRTRGRRGRKRGRRRYRGTDRLAAYVEALTVQAHPSAGADTFLEGLTLVEALAELSLEPPPEGKGLLAWSKGQAYRLRTIRSRAERLARLLAEEEGQRTRLLAYHLEQERDAIP